MVAARGVDVSHLGAAAAAERMDRPPALLRGRLGVHSSRILPPVCGASARASARDVNVALMLRMAAIPATQRV